MIKINNKKTEVNLKINITDLSKENFLSLLIIQRPALFLSFFLCKNVCNIADIFCC